MFKVLLLEYPSPYFLIIILVSVVSCCGLLPVYIIDNIPKFPEFTLQELTMKPSDQKNRTVIWVVFFITIVFSMLGHILIYFFEEKIKVIPSLSRSD
jgi:amino acid permease